eukprot:1151211-Prymnesium_polylepis.3
MEVCKDASQMVHRAYSRSAVAVECSQVTGGSWRSLFRSCFEKATPTLYWEFRMWHAGNVCRVQGPVHARVC